MTNDVSGDASSDALAAEEQEGHSRWSEDLLAIGIGWIVLVVSLLCVSVERVPAAGGESEAVGESRIAGWVAKPQGWSQHPSEAFLSGGEIPTWAGVLGVLAVGLVAFGAALKLKGQRFREFAPAFGGVFLLATAAYVLAGQALIKSYNLEYALWALAAGLIVSNTIGTPRWLRPGIRTEFYIKTGLVLLGGEILVSRLLALGLPGVFVAWVVTPIVLISTFWFGQRILKIQSPSLNMVISSDMSVCGVSAAIASAAACRAKKEELSLAIGLSLSFTVVMMAVMPAVIGLMGIDDVLGGAWMGGVIDATGAVAAAGAMLGDEALQVAATIKMIQNILIGVVAFGIAVFWVSYIEKDESGQRPGISEVWLRFPKFILGFIAASIFFSLVHGLLPSGPEMVDTSIKSTTKILRGWFFCLAFVSIGLQTNFRELAKQLSGGKPLVLYLVGQTLNIILTLAMAYLMFKVVFPDAADALVP